MFGGDLRSPRPEGKWLRLGAAVGDWEPVVVLADYTNTGAGLILNRFKVA